MSDSPEYHAAHLAFSRATIVQSAARGERILDLLKTYTDDVVESQRDLFETAWVCDLCGQLLGGPDDRCNSGIHQGLDDPDGCRGRAVKLIDPTAAVAVVEAWDQWLEHLIRIEHQLRGHAPFAQAMEDLRATIQRSRL